MFMFIAGALAGIAFTFLVSITAACILVGRAEIRDMGGSI